MKRTGRQNNSAHLYFEQLATALNEAGFTQDVVLTHKLIQALEALISLWGDDIYASQLQATLEKNRPRVGLSWTKE